MKNFKLPFDKVTARALILRRKDGALLGTLHKPNGKYAPPGGAIKRGEEPEAVLLRELEEEKILLLNPDSKWQERLTVDYFHGKRSLNLWYLVMVDDVQLGEAEEFNDTRWLDQTQDVWYPGMREKILLAIEQHIPDLMRVHVSVLESW